MKAYLLVTHLLGSGHLARMALLARAFRAEGWDVALVSGGRPAPHLVEGLDGLEQLPPLASDGVDFRNLLDESGGRAGPELHAERRRQAVAALERLRPDVVITELFPFGRRQLAGEFETVLDAAMRLSPRPVILASVRDILQQPSKPERVAEAEARLTRFYDGVLVHGAADIAPLSASWPVTPTIEAMLRYTGYVAAAPAGDGGSGERSQDDPGGEDDPGAEDGAGGEDGAGEVLVAAGGGPVGDALFDAACGAARLTPDLRWRLLVGGSGAAREARIARLAALAAGTSTIVEPVRPDYRRMLARCAVSVSQIGYNTAVDLLQAGCPAVLAPFEEGGETEQRQRAEAFADRFGMAALPPGDPSPEALARAVEQARKGGPRLADPTRGSEPIDLDGARRSVAIAAAAVERRRKRDG